MLVARLGAAGFPDSPGLPGSPEPVVREARGLLVAREARGFAAAGVAAEQAPRVAWGSDSGQAAA